VIQTPEFVARAAIMSLNKTDTRASLSRITHGDACAASRIFQAAMWCSALETKAAALTLSLENVVFLQSRKRF
jgi:hypothetical protein